MKLPTPCKHCFNKALIEVMGRALISLVITSTPLALIFKNGLQAITKLLNSLTMHADYRHSQTMRSSLRVTKETLLFNCHEHSPGAQFQSSPFPSICLSVVLPLTHCGSWPFSLFWKDLAEVSTACPVSMCWQILHAQPWQPLPYSPGFSWNVTYPGSSPDQPIPQPT